MRYFLILLSVLLCLPCAVQARDFTIDQVRVEGNRRIERQIILTAASAKAGLTVNEKMIDRDLREIFKLGKFEDVSAEIVSEGGRSVLVYRVVERPVVRKIVYEGNKEIDAPTLKGLTKFKTPGFYAPKEVFETVRAIKSAYIDEGHHSAVVEHDLQVDERNEATLTFKIDEGKRVLIDSIRFEGNTVFSDRELRKGIQTEESWIFSYFTDRGAYNEEILQNDLTLIADMYFDKGYVKVKVKQPDVTLTEDGEGLDVLIEVAEGPQYSVGTVDLQGDLIAEKQTLLDLNQLIPGEMFSRKTLRDSMLALNSYYADRGYAYVNVVPLTDLDEENRQLNIKYDIEKGLEVTIGRIEINGNTTTVDKVIRREIAVAEGDRYNASALNLSRRKINNLGFFEEVNVNTRSSEGDKQVMDINVDVKGKPTGNFTLGFGYSSIDKFVAQGSVEQQNFLGRGLNLKASGSFGGASTTYRLGLLDPYFLDSTVSLGFDVYKTEREWAEYTEKKTGGDLKFGFPVAPELRAFFIYRYEQKNISDINPLASTFLKSQAGDSILSSIFGSLSHDTLDYRPDPSEGGRTEVSLEYAGLGGTEKFARGILDHRHFFKGPWSTVFSVHGNLGYIMDIGGEPIPVSERFYLGGIRTIRGFKTREVGPRVKRFSNVVDPITGAVIASTSDFEYTGGNKAAYFNLEYFFPLAKEAGVKGLLFADAGDAWNEDQNMFSSLRYSVGAGVRWASPMGPLRFEWGYNLDPLEGEKQSVFEFTMGSFF